MNFRLAPGRINAEIDADGKTLDLYIIPGGKLYSRDTSPIPPNALVLKEALPVSKISTTGPSKMVRTLRRKSGIKPDEVNYLVTTVDPDHPQGHVEPVPEGQQRLLPRGDQRRAPDALLLSPLSRSSSRCRRAPENRGRRRSRR